MFANPASTWLPGTVSRRIAARLAMPQVYVPAAVIVAVTAAWVLCMPRTLLIGDDLYLVRNLRDASWAKVFHGLSVDHAGNKWRPLLLLVLRAIIGAFGTRFAAYVALNSIVEIASALTIASITLRLTRGSTLLATLAGCAFVVSRFAYYNLIQVQGIMEGLAMLLMLLALRAVVVAYQERRLGALWSTPWLAALAIFTDERYLAIAPFLVAAPLLHPARRSNLRAASALALANCVAPLAYAAVKLFVFRAPLASGTGSTALKPHAAEVWAFLLSAVANMLGFNAGNGYFTGRDMGDVGVPAYVAGALVCVPLLLVLGRYVLDVARRRAASQPLVLGLVLFIPLLLTTTVTIRQEFRWLYAPFAVVVVALAAAGGRFGPRSVPAALAAFALIACVGGAVYYRQFATTVFFMHDMAVAASLRDALLRTPAQRVVLVVHRDRSFQSWAFGKGVFFRVYGLDSSRVRFVDEPQEATDETGPVTLLSVEMTEAGVVPVAMPRVVVVPYDGVRLAFEPKFDQSVVEPARSMPTPSGRGAFLFPYHGEVAGTSSLTVLSGFRCTFRRVPIVRGERLVFYVAQPRASAAPSRAFVSVRDASGAADVFSAIVPPSGAEPAWRAQNVPLARFAGRTVDVTFGADPTTADRSAWVAFAEPSLVVARR
jgi:hypothetical protein